MPGGATDTWVRVSIDEGKTWVAIATGLAKNKAEIDRTHLPAGKCLIEVVVHDGFRSLRSAAVEFENSALPPVPAILHPHEGRVLVAGRTLYLWGTVAGQRNQSHEGFRYVWKLDGKPVGEGLHVFTVTPPPGSHRCEFLVQNARGRDLRASSVAFMSEADAR